MLPDAPAICRSHLDFMKWADEKILAAVTPVAADHLTRPAGVSFTNLLGTVQHIYQGEKIWIRRVKGEPDVKLAEIEAPSIEELQTVWPALHAAWREWALNLDADGWNRTTFIRLANGAESRLPNWQIVLHLVNHGSYHRGQVTSLLRAAGVTPVGTDLVHYYRSLAAKAS